MPNIQVRNPVSRLRVSPPESVRGVIVPEQGATGPAGVDGAPGPKGDTGATGPKGDKGDKGDPGTNGTGGTTGAAFLSGYGPPAAGSGLDPLNGVNDPWRWCVALNGWISPAVTVSWQQGDVIPSIDPPPGENSGYLQLVVTYADTPLGYTGETIIPANPQTGLSTTSGPVTISQPGARGTAFLIWHPGDNLTKFPSRDNVLPDLKPNVRDLLGPLVIQGDWAYPESGVGNAGDFYLNLAPQDDVGNVSRHIVEIWGPKDADYGWGTPYHANGFDGNDYHVFANGQVFQPPSYDPLIPPIMVGAGQRPPDNYYGAGQVALWYEDTAGAPKLHIDALDSDGTRFDMVAGEVGGVVLGGVSGSHQFEFVQSTPVATWVINHGLNGKPPVSLVLAENPNEAVYTDVRYLDNNTITVQWPQPESGWAYL